MITPLTPPLIWGPGLAGSPRPTLHPEARGLLATQPIHVPHLLDPCPNTQGPPDETQKPPRAHGAPELASHPATCRLLCDRPVRFPMPPASVRRPGPTPTLAVPCLQALSSPTSVNAGSASSGHCPPPESHARGHTQSRDGAPRVSQEPDGRELGGNRPCHPDSHRQSSRNLRPLSRQVPGGGHPA